MQIVVLSEHEHLRLGEHCGQKMLLLFDLCSKLVCRVNGRIDIPPKSFLSWLYSGDHIAKRCVADDQQIDVAGGVELTPRSRAEHERSVHTICERHQSLPQNVSEYRGLGQQAL